MAKRLLKAGHKVVVYNRTRERAQALEGEGAAWAGSPREAAERCDIVISMVTDDAASRALWLDPDDPKSGAVAGLRKGAIAIESSTVTPSWVRQLGEAVAGRGAELLDAPVVGSRPQAEAGALIYLVGGAEAPVAAAREILAALGGTLHHVGPAGSGTILKLAVNALFGCQVAALAEIVGMVRRAGLDPKSAIELLGKMPIASPALQGVGAQMAARAFAPLFPVNLVEKDFRYVLEAAAQVQAATPVCAAVREVYAQAQRQGHGEENISGVVQVFE
jgi:3-hydroxyisobutyrate dehydrogenase-like beta-hydroxyacid dehydrogenase